MFALIMTLEGQAKKAIPAAEYEAMLSGIAREDSAAFERFYRSTDRTLYTYILSLTRNHHDAQDVMMDTYLKVRANAHRYVPQGKPLAWVFTIARNLVRSRQREAARETLYGDVTEVELAFPATDTQDDALALREAMTVLSEEERQIVLFHAVSGMKHRELSELLELPLSTVLSKYARALAKLKKALTSHSKEVTDHA